ncbi:unnamed protein product [Clonostachys chloroleuca]|uniref:DUF6604 domain-containing protein n=1 Tax=Clonostachys chloroleuca TaxID=1926264 RepID=A0AA35Q6T2_9HYPO|nr:unnamed protein product [Clonostachys chloroleuca]
MLPSALVSVYQQYKADTDAIAGWLALTAKAANYSDHPLSPPTTSTGRLKGKARALAKEQALKPKKAILPIKLFVPLAKYITSLKAPRILVPQSVINITERVIRQRSVFSSRLSHHGANPSVEGDRSHSYFVDILQQVVCLFRQNVAQSPTPSVESIHSDELGNRFASLHVEEPSQEFLNATSAKQSTAENNIVYEAEPQTDLDDAIAAYGMLLQDLNKIRDEIKQIWLSCAEGSVELTAAAIATNTGVDLARYLIDQVLPIFQLHGGIGEVAEAFALQFIRKQDLNDSDLDPEEIDAIVDEMMIVVNDFARRLASCRDCADRQNEPWKPTPEPIQELLDKIEDEVASDNQLLGELVNNLHAVGWLAKGYLKVDEIMSGLDQMQTTKTAPFYVCFALQVTLDIHHTLGDWCLEPAKHLDKELNFMIESIDQFYKDSANMSETMCKTCDCLKKFQQEIKDFQSDPTIESRKQFYNCMNYASEPSEERHRSMQLSPVLCGLTIFYFRASMHDFGFIEFGRHYTIKHAVHLYNALVKEGLMENPWGDMQLAENFYGRSNIFAGQKPESTRGYIKQLMIHEGMTVRGLSELFGTLDGHSTSCGEPRTRGYRNKKKAPNRGAPVSAIFIERYYNRSQRIDYRPEDVDEIISRRRRDEASPSPNKCGRHSPHLLLQPLAEALTEESLEVAFPRLLMHKVCGEFLMQVKGQCVETIEEALRQKVRGRELVMIIFSLLISDEILGKELLSRAASIANEIVASGSGKRLVDVMDTEFDLSREQLEEVCSKSKLAEDF